MDCVNLILPILVTCCGEMGNVLNRELSLSFVFVPRFSLRLSIETDIER